MYRFKALLVWLALFAAVSAAAQTGESSTPQKAKPFRPISFTTVAVQFLSWAENANITNGTVNDPGTANLFGNALVIEHEHYYLPRWGYILSGGYIFGMADVGGGATLNYQNSSQNWSGVEASLREAYRLSKWVITSAGAMVIYRTLNFPADINGVTVTSGANINYAGTVDLRLRLSEEFELREEIGSLFLKAATYWSLGVGYKFIF